MVGGKSRPKKDKALKVSEGELVPAGKILVRGLSTYKAGINVKEGSGVLHALCSGRVKFTKKKTPSGKVRTFVNVISEEKN